MDARESDSESEEEGEFYQNVDGFGMQPYQFEPEFEDGEEESGGEASDGSDNAAEAEDEDEDENAWRVDNHAWCLCFMCVAMPTIRESHCCVELDRNWKEKVDLLR